MGKNMKLNKITTAILSATAVAGTMGMSSGAQADAFYDALSGGKAKLDVRLRYEQVNQDGVEDAGGESDTADAFTIRTRLGYETAELLKTTAYVEMEDVRVVAGIDDYAPETAGYPTVADPRSTELNQAYLSIKPVEGLDIIGGRQRLILDNARFIGNVGWRQNEQTFDALTVKYKAAGFDVTAAYLTQINGITPKFDSSAENTILNLGYTFKDVGKLSAYYYDLDQKDDLTKSPLQIETTGARFAGKAGGDLKYHYAAEFATQDNAVNDKSADYMFGEFGIGIKPITVFVGYELLGSDDGAYGFQTPLATKHAFNGWADKFLATPAEGLQDTYIKAVSKFAGMKLAAIYHTFAADNVDGMADGDDSFGEELDIVLVKPFAKKYTVGLKYAMYSAEENDLAAKYGLTDTDKLWIWGEMKF